MIRIIGEYWAVAGYPLILLFVSFFVVKDWTKWKRYYPTILFTINIDLATASLSYNYQLWHFNKALFLSNHTLNCIWIAFTQFPLMFLMYLSRYPYKARWWWQSAYMSLWAVVMSMVEGFYVLLKCTTYHHGWNFWWSVLFWFTMFPILRLHYSHPLLAWLVSVPCSLFVILYFHIPITQLY